MQKTVDSSGLDLKFIILNEGTGKFIHVDLSLNYVAWLLRLRKFIHGMEAKNKNSQIVLKNLKNYSFNTSQT